MTGHPRDLKPASRLAAEAAPHADEQALLRSGGLPEEVEALVVEVTGQNRGLWPASASLVRLLARAILARGLRNVIEFGAGSSSAVAAGTLSTVGGGRLTSIEEHPEWCRAHWTRVEGFENVDAALIQARPVPALGRLGIYYRYDVPEARVRARGPYDLVFVDGPQHFYGRGGALPLLRRSLAPGALIVVDDARRAGEQEAIQRWLRAYGGLELALLDPTFGNKGVAVLRVTGAVTPRFSARTFAAGVNDGFRRLYRNRAQGREPAEAP